MDKVKGITVSSCFVSFLVWHYWPDTRLSWTVWHVLSKLVIIHWKETNYSSTSSTEENKLQYNWWFCPLGRWNLLQFCGRTADLKCLRAHFHLPFPYFTAFALLFIVMSSLSFFFHFLTSYSSSYFFFFAFLSFSHSPPSLDFGSWWSSNGVYGEPAFTTSEANRQVSSVFLAHCGSCSHSLHAPLYYHHLQQLHLQKALSAPSPAPLIHASQAEFSTASFWCVPLFNMLPSFVKALLRQQILTKITAHARLWETPFLCGFGRNEKELSHLLGQRSTILQQLSHVHACMPSLQFLYQYTQLLSRGGEKHTTFLHLALFPPLLTQLASAAEQ